MKQEYLEELISFSNKEEFVSKKLIEKIIYDIVDEDCRLNQVIFGVTSWSGDVKCSCDINYRNILVDYEKLRKDYNKSKKSSLQKNLILLSYLFHEVEHLKEDSIISLLNFESLLISYSSIDIFYPLAESKLKHMKYFIADNIYIKMLEKQQDQLYLKIYDKIPGERIANIRAYKQVFEAVNYYPNFKEKYIDDFKFINNLYKDQYYLGYDNYKKKDKFYKGPLLDYLKFIKMTGLLDDFDFYCEDIKRFLEKSSKEFSIEERMLYGLPVTLKETDELDKKLILTK